MTGRLLYQDNNIGMDVTLCCDNMNYSVCKTPQQVVIKYVPYVGDSKRAMDEYVSEIMMGGRSTIAIHNTCEDSLLASPIILDLIILTELCQVGDRGLIKE